MKEKGLLQKGDLIVSVSVKNPKNAKQPKRAKLEIPSSVPPDSFQPKCTCRIGLFLNRFSYFQNRDTFWNSKRSFQLIPRVNSLHGGRANSRRNRLLWSTSKWSKIISSISFYSSFCADVP